MSLIDRDALLSFADVAQALVGSMQAFIVQLQAIAAQPIVSLPTSPFAVPRLYTPDRDALIQQRYADEGPSDSLIAALNALPGLLYARPMQVMNRASALGVRRREAKNSGPDNALYTKARGKLIEARYPAEGASPAIIADLNNLPGRAFVDRKSVSSYAKKLGIGRADGWRNAPRAKRKLVDPRKVAPAPISATAAQIDMLSRDYPAGVAGLALVEAAGALGPAMNPADIARACLLLKLSRPQGFDARAANATWRSSLEKSPGPVIAAAESDTSELSPVGWRNTVIDGIVDPVPPPRPALPRPSHAAERPVRAPQVATPPGKPSPPPSLPRIAAPPVFIQGHTGCAPSFRTHAQLRRDAEAELVAAHIAAKGVTRCPAAASDASTATISAEDRAAVHAYTEAQREAYEAKCKSNGARLAENRLRRLNGKPLIAAVHA